MKNSFIFFLHFFFTVFPLARAACTKFDHQTCDELCKSDSFWYGHCSGWDGVDFSCSCFEYKAPLKGEVCKPKQSICMAKCKSNGSEGGFCYPQEDRKGTKGRTGCECFKQLPDLARKKRAIREKKKIHIIKFKS